MLEANTWGLLFYANEIEERNPHYQGIQLYQFVGDLLVFLEHAKTMYNELKYKGGLFVLLTLNNILDVPWIYPEYDFANTGPSSKLDDSVTFSLQATTDIMEQGTIPLVKEILQLIFYSTNWDDLANDPQMLHNIIIKGYELNAWNADDIKNLF